MSLDRGGELFLDHTFLLALEQPSVHYPACLPLSPLPVLDVALSGRPLLCPCAITAPTAPRHQACSLESVWPAAHCDWTPQGHGLKQFWGRWSSQNSVPKACPLLSGWTLSSGGSGTPGDMPATVSHPCPPGDRDGRPGSLTWAHAPLHRASPSLSGV